MTITQTDRGFEVQSPSGNTYQVNPLGDCSCPAAQYRPGLCKHAKAIEDEFGEDFGPADHEPMDLITETVNEARGVFASEERREAARYGC